MVTLEPLVPTATAIRLTVVIAITKVENPAFHKVEIYALLQISLIILIY